MKQKTLKDLTTWLVEHECEILPITNPYELVRFSCETGKGVIYKGKKGIGFSSELASNAYWCFVNKRPWNADIRGNKKRLRKRTALISRDGHVCFYCGKSFKETDLTQEHLVSRADGGGNGMANLVLACEPCNTKAGHLPLIQKIELREQLRANK